MSLVSYRLHHPSTVPYVYQTLGKFQIRLLTLAPGKESDGIHIRLDHVDLKTDPAVDFEALSYVWGSSEPTQCVIVDTDDGSSQFIPVRDNLADALRRIRDPAATKTLWIDALCLDQGDDDEKGHQVPFMAEIYRRAARVIVWLGTERDDSASAMRMLRELGENMTLDWTTDWELSESFDDIWETLENDASLKAAIQRLLERDWFERLWVLQEVHLSQRSTIFCGPSEVELNVFMGAALHFAIHISRRLVDTTRDLSWRRRILWAELRKVVGGKRCTDLRDKIYGTLAMMDDNYIRLLNVDYSLSVPEVYTAATKHYVQTSKELTLFIPCELTSDRMDNLPSWVPDWSTKPSTSMLGMGSATGLTRSSVDFPGAKTMRLEGVMSSKVQSVEPLGGTVDEATDAIVRFMHRVRVDEKYADGNQSFGDALLCAIIGGQYRHATMPPADHYPSREECRSALRYLASLATGTTPDIADGAAYFDQMTKVLAAWRGRALFLTRDGYIGLGLQEVRTGDRLFFPLGFSWPLLVRAKGGSPKFEWSLVSTCYVSGLMAGEILYGPVPSAYTMVKRMDNNEPMLRAGFHRVDSNFNVSSEPDLEFEKERTRKAFGIESEKLLTPELLRSKGVPVGWMYLI